MLEGGVTGSPFRPSRTHVGVSFTQTFERPHGLGGETSPEKEGRVWTGVCPVTGEWRGDESGEGAGGWTVTGEWW